MLYRRTYLESRTSLGNSGQRVTDINVRDPITALWVEFRCANGATDNVANLLSQCVSAIEVIDGAKVLYSLDGCEALALSAYHLGRLPDQLVSEWGGVTQNLSIVIPFGRYEGDTELSFDPTRFVNPQVPGHQSGCGCDGVFRRRVVSDHHGAGHGGCSCAAWYADAQGALYIYHSRRRGVYRSADRLSLSRPVVSRRPGRVCVVFGG